MTKRRVLLIHHSGLFGGAGLSLLDLWQHLEREYEVTALIPESPPDLRDILLARGYEAKTFPGRLGKLPYYSGGESLLRPRFWYYFMLTIMQRGRWKRIIEREGPEIVVVNSGVLCWMVKVMTGVVSICYVRETMRGRPTSLINRYLRRLRDKFDAVCYLSEYDLAQDKLGSATQLLVPDAVDPVHFSMTFDRREACEQLGVSTRPFNVLYLGGASVLKGYDQMLRVAKYLRGVDIQVIMAGYLGPSRRRWGLVRGPGRRRADRELAELANELEAEGVTRSTGIVPDVRVAYAACDVVVFPMREPHQARPAFEAGFQGKPIIISGFQNVRGCVEHGVNGLLFRPGDERDLARAILMIASNPVELERMGAENRRHALARHSRDSAFEELNRFLRGTWGRGRELRGTGRPGEDGFGDMEK